MKEGKYVKECTSRDANFVCRVDGKVRITKLPCYVYGKVVIIPSEGTVVSAVVTVAQSSVADLLYNVYTPGAYSGGFDLAASSLQLDSLTAPGVVTMA